MIVNKREGRIDGWMEVDVWMVRCMDG